MVGWESLTFFSPNFASVTDSVRSLTECYGRCSDTPAAVADASRGTTMARSYEVAMLGKQEAP